MERSTTKAAEPARSKIKTQLEIVQTSSVSSMRGMSAYVKPVCGRTAAEVRRDYGGQSTQHGMLRGPVKIFRAKFLHAYENMHRYHGRDWCTVPTEAVSPDHHATGKKKEVVVVVAERATVPPIRAAVSSNLSTKIYVPIVPQF